MAAPEITSGDCTTTVAYTATKVLAVNHPGWLAGDLLIFNLCNDGGTTGLTCTPPTLPDSETWTVLANQVTSPEGGTHDIWIGYFIAAGTVSAGTVDFTYSQDKWCVGIVVKVEAGDFDATDPVSFGSHGGGTYQVNYTSPPSTAFTAGADDGGGRLCAFFGTEYGSISGVPADWTNISTAANHTVIGSNFSTRDTDTTNSESVPSYTWTNSDSYASVNFLYIIRGLSPPLLAYWSETYGTPFITSETESYYNISEIFTIGYVEPMAYTLLASWREPYKSTPQHLAFWREFYTAAPEYIRAFVEPYISAAELLAFWREEWTEQPAILAAWVEPYRVADAALLVSITEPYSLEEMSQLIPHWKEPYAMTIGTSLYQRVERVH